MTNAVEVADIVMGAAQTGDELALREALDGIEDESGGQYYRTAAMYGDALSRLAQRIPKVTPDGAFHTALADLVVHGTPDKVFRSQLASIERDERSRARVIGFDEDVAVTLAFANALVEVMHVMHGSNA